ncbi:MAG: HAMP domain-containing protein [Pseudomonadota bacterium]|nr:MAG: HAMP domain-containing protein [Pseudomonadota bacterium]
MESRSLRRYLTGVIPLLALSVLLLAALLMTNAATQNSALFGRLYSVLLVVNIAGIGLLIALIVLNLFRLIAQYRQKVPGSRLTARLLVILVVLSVVPVSIVFVFSAQTLNRGIDNWFDVRIERALDDALLLGRAALDALKQDLAKGAQEMAAELESLSYLDRADRGRPLITTLNYLRERHEVSEITLFSHDAKILGTSIDTGPEAGNFVPERPNDAVFAQVRQGQTYAAVEVAGRSGLRIRVAVPVYTRDVGTVRVLQVMEVLPPRYTKLGESVQSAFAEYEKLIYLRGPLKFGFTLTLGLVALVTMLIAVWAAMVLARRVTAPIRELAEGTRAVADGDYRKQVPVTSHDELGMLAASFNDMTRRIHRAQTQSKRSQREAETQRAYLETVLTHLSSGVLSVDRRQVLRTHNAAAEQILGVELKQAVGKPLRAIGTQHPLLAGVVDTIQGALARAQPEWRTEVDLLNNGNTRTLILRGTLLPGSSARRGGYVIVFDDVTALIQAQRDAAWAEVARRMAHEIKNPLTPIQLSAERIRHKFLRQLPEAERATLDRSTRTIVEQVESLKSLVNAFSDYARGAQMQTQPVDLNRLIRDVAELYSADTAAGFERSGGRGAEIIPLRPADAARPVALEFALAEDLPNVSVDPGALRQVLHNLLINARDALGASASPKIYIATRPLTVGDQDWVELSVRDNGPGIPEEFLARLFEPYVTSKERGTGLGLAIVKRIVDEHGGQIEAFNVADGGACVVIRLPIKSPRTRETPAAGAARRTGGRA